MSREWKPGDVGTFGSRPALRTKDGWAHFDGSVGGLYQDEYNVRPLVVIDPKDAEAVKRLLIAVLAQSDPLHPDGSGLAAAHPAFAAPKPPHPHQPTGLGARGVDAGGRRYVRCDEDSRHRWHCPDDETGSSDNFYADITAIEVLSEGVPS